MRLLQKNFVCFVENIKKKDIKLNLINALDNVDKVAYIKKQEEY